MFGSNENPDRSQPQGVIFNAYPDSIGHKLADTVDLLQRPEYRRFGISTYSLAKMIT
jgi:sucrose phosphorylase